MRRRRVERLRQAMERHGADALVAGRGMCRFLTGFEGELVVVTGDRLLIPSFPVPRLLSMLREAGEVGVYPEDMPCSLAEHLLGQGCSPELGRKVVGELRAGRDRRELRCIAAAGRLAELGGERGEELVGRLRDSGEVERELRRFLLQEGAEEALVRLEPCTSPLSPPRFRVRPPVQLTLRVRFSGFWAELSRVVPEDAADAYGEAWRRAFRKLSPGIRAMDVEVEALRTLQELLGSREWECQGSFLHGTGVSPREAPRMHLFPGDAGFTFPWCFSLSLGHAWLRCEGVRVRVEHTLVLRGRRAEVVTGRPP